MVDLSAIKPMERTVEICSAGTNPQPLGIRLTIISVQDEKMARLRRNFHDAERAANLKNKTLKAVEIENNSDELLCAAITGWEWYNPTGSKGEAGYDADAMPQWGGEVLEFNKKNVLMLLRQEWFSSQVSREVGDTEAFFEN